MLANFVLVKRGTYLKSLSSEIIMNFITSYNMDTLINWCFIILFQSNFKVKLWSNLQLFIFKILFFFKKAFYHEKVYRDYHQNLLEISDYIRWLTFEIKDKTKQQNQTNKEIEMNKL